jgi:MFS superfamily sulfate permease-like transporter
VGVKTPFANVVTSLFVTLVLVAATRLLFYVPQAVLGALICTAVLALLDFKEMWRALWVAPVDFGIMLLTFTITVFWNVEAGLQWGLLASVLVLLLQISRLDMDSIGQLSLAHDETTTSLRSNYPKLRPVATYPGAVQHEQVGERTKCTEDNISASK